MAVEKAHNISLALADAATTPMVSQGVQLHTKRRTPLTTPNIER